MEDVKMDRKESKMFSSNINIKEIAEEHWKYTEGIIKRGMLIENCKEKFRILDICSLDNIWLELCHYLYVAAMIHGFKHCEDELKSHGYFNEKEIQE